MCAESDAVDPGFPGGFDAALLGSLAASGLFAGAISACWVLRCVFQGRPAWVHRLNSWDLALHPLDSVHQLLAPFVDPGSHIEAWSLTLAYAALVFTWGMALELLVPSSKP
ncbi:MAG: hypothetical protein AAGA48_35225 [Myxococcota bacterium]